MKDERPVRLVERALFAPVHPARPWLAMRTTLCLFAFDAFIDMMGHGGRYGLGGFNVAHFAWLDAIQPTPTATTYGTVMFLAGLFALYAVVTRAHVLLRAAVAVLVTYGWAMSLLDSYQHHYLFSLLFACFVFFPEAALAPAPPRATDDRDQVGPRGTSPLANGKLDPRTKGDRKARRAAERAAHKRARQAIEPSRAESSLLSPAPAYAVACFTIAIVYLFTAVSKTEPEWRSGDALRRIVAPSGALDALHAFWTARGLSLESLYGLLGQSIVPLQIVIAAGYLLAPFRDVARARWVSLASHVALVGALSFHLGAEYIELKIGWFSWYMLLFALVAMAPTTAIAACAAGLARLFAPIARALEGEATASSLGPATHPARERHAADRSDATRDAAGERAASDDDDATRVRDERKRALAPASLAAAAALLGPALGKLADIPGAFEATVTASASVLAVSTWCVVRGRVLPKSFALAALVAPTAMWVAIANSEVRFDYYRFVAGDARRRGEYERALAYYVKTNRYAPPGKDRRDREAEMRRLLEDGGGSRRGADAATGAPP